MQHRDDIKGGQHAPQSILDALRRFGGENPHGEPMYRMVVAESVYSKSGGRWHDWDPNLPLADRGGMQIEVSDKGDLRGFTSVHRPIRIVDEIRETQKYPHLSGWILERWVPAWMFGSPSSWYAIQATAEEPAEDQFGQPYLKKINLNLPLLGPYPERGDYMLCSTPRTDMIGIGELQEVIAAVEAMRVEYMHTTQGQVTQRVYERVYQQEKRDKAEREERTAALRDLLRPLYSSSLEMGALRSRMAEQAGVREHNGN